MSFVFPPADPVSLPVVGQAQRVPVNRVFCVGQNYAKHAREMGGSGRQAPFFFMKPAHSVVPTEAGQIARIPYPDHTQSLHHEIELVVVIGKAGQKIQPPDAERHVYGYAVGFDLTRRDLQSTLKEKGRPWEVAKAFEASAPIGPVTPLAARGWLRQAAIGMSVNGQTRQNGDIDEMIWPVTDVIAHLSQHWYLQPGDLIFTGTPEGVGAVVRGDRLHGRVEGLEDLRIELV
ncbi:MAG: fumarylacetoacetate hydrolase family protein [Lautropia sp.]|nr:fumarylacetoacetate hydrolase family protein [Lautropia sp.]